MDPSCNPTVRGVNPLHRYACPIARIALSVWRASPSAFAEFDHWLFVPYQPRSPEEVKAEAQRLVGPAGLAQAMEDPWLEKRMKEAITIYQAVGAGRIPNLLMPHAMIQGTVPNLGELTKVLDQQFANPVPQPK
jgi:hypothetical protein